MDYSASNTLLWDVIIQFGIIAASVIVANVLRRKIPFFRKSLMPTAVLAGFILLILNVTGVLNLNETLLEIVTYHGIAIGFIAMSLRVFRGEEKDPQKALIGAKSGALIVSTYAVQAIIGLTITILLALTVMPGLFKASGILLPMGFGQGPGQANNVGSTYEALGFEGGRSFGLSLAASGYLVACVIGVIFLNILAKKEGIKRLNSDEVKGSVTIDLFQDEGEIPLSESLDKFSMQVALVLMTYLLTFLLTKGITGLISAVLPGLAGTVNSLLWGFNFILGSLLATVVKTVINKLKKAGVVKRQYQNNYLLNRISGFAFDIMIIAGIASIRIDELKGLWLPFILLSIAGAIGTWLYLKWMCKKLYPGYYYEALMSMFGMLTGTISSGILLLRELDPNYKTPAANNLVLGSTFGIGFGVPVLILIGLAPESDMMLYITYALAIIYLLILILFILKAGNKKAGK